MTTGRLVRSPTETLHHAALAPAVCVAFATSEPQGHRRSESWRFSLVHFDLMVHEDGFLKHGKLRVFLQVIQPVAGSHCRDFESEA